MLRVARNKGNLSLVRLLVDAGYDLRRGVEPLPFPVSPKLSPVEEFLATACKTPLALKKITRLALRRRLKTPLEDSLKDVPLPAVLKQYLQFADHVDPI